MPESEVGSPKASLGILFVHGIGDQPRGATLATMGEALYDWLRRWGRSAPPTVLHTGRFDVELSRVYLVEPPADAPAHAWLHFVVAPVGEREATAPVDWLLAEAWWARGFHGSSFRRLITWGLKAGPWIALTHVMASLDRLVSASSGSVLRLPQLAFGVLLATITGLLAAIGISVLALALVLLSLVALPGIREFVGRVRTRLADSLGDARELVESDFQYEAMTRQVLDALEWLDSKSESVAVVAHSQGAAVATHALERWTGRKVGLFVTFGSALNKLRSFRQDRGVVWFGIAAVVGVLVSPYAVSVLWAMVIGEPVTAVEGTAAWVTGFVAAVGAIGLWGAYHSVRTASAQPFPYKPAAAKWLDYWASRDPVSNGPLARTTPDGVITTEVWNNDFIFTDHTSYWTNRDGFVAQLAAHLAELASSTPAFVGDDAHRIEGAAVRRRWRFAWRRRIVPFGLIGIGLTVLGLSRVLAELGGWVAGWLRGLASDVPEPFGTTAEWVTAPLAAIPDVAVGGAVLALFVVAAVSIASLPWSAWTASDFGATLTRSPYGGGLGYLVVATLVSGILLATGIATFMQGHTPIGVSPSVATYAFSASVVPVLVVFFLLLWPLQKLAPTNAGGGTGRMWLSFPIAVLWFMAVGALFPITNLLLIVVAASVPVTISWFVPVAWRRLDARLLIQSQREPTAPTAHVPRSARSVRTESMLVAAGGFGLLLFAFVHPQHELFAYLFWMGGWLLAGYGLFECPRTTRLEWALSISGGAASAASIAVYATNWRPLG